MADIAPGTWIVVADSEKALFLENIGEADHPHLKVRRKEVQDNPPDREQAADRPGWQQESRAFGKSSYAETDFHELAKDRFASDLADLLYARAHAGAFERLVIVAAPDVLGALRKEMHREVSDRVVAEVPKLLTGVPIDDLERRLPQDIEDAA